MKITKEYLKRIFSRNFIICLSLCLYCLLNQVALFLGINYGVFPKYIFFDICFLFFICGILTCITNKWVKASLVQFLMAFVFVISIATNIIHYSTNEQFSFYMLSLASDGVGAFDFSFLDLPSLITTLLIFVSFTVIIWCTTKSKNYYDEKIEKKKCNYFLLFSFIVCELIGVGGYFIQVETLEDVTIDVSAFYMVESDRYLYDTLEYKANAMTQFGFFGYYTKDLTDYIFKVEHKTETNQRLAEWLASGEQVKSEHFGVAKDKNVITILCETLEYYAIDPVFTPNLYNYFFNEGVHLKNYYANNRTNISEGLVINGSYPVYSSINNRTDDILKTLSNDYLDFSMPKLLEGSGDYKTQYWHNYTSYYYGRYITHSNDYIGFDKVVGLEQLDRIEDFEEFGEDGDAKFYEWYNWTLDSEVVEEYKKEMFPIYEDGSKFYTHFSTMSTHGRFAYREQLVEYHNELLATKGEDNGKYEQLWDYLIGQGFTKPTDPDVIERFEWYKSAAMDLDKMIGMLFDYLEDPNEDGNTDDSILEDTIVLMFADHYAYYHNLSYYMNGVEPNYQYAHETTLYQIPVTIYDQDLVMALNGTSSYEENKSYDYMTYCNTYDICPTMLDLLGLEYNPNMYYGYSIFNDSISETVFQENISEVAFFTDKIYMIRNKIKFVADGVTEADIEEFKEKVLALYYKRLYMEQIYANPEVFELYAQIKNAGTPV